MFCPFSLPVNAAASCIYVPRFFSCPCAPIFKSVEVRHFGTFGLSSFFSGNLPTTRKWTPTHQTAECFSCSCFMGKGWRSLQHHHHQHHNNQAEHQQTARLVYTGSFSEESWKVNCISLISMLLFSYNMFLFIVTWKSLKIWRKSFENGHVNSTCHGVLQSCTCTSHERPHVLLICILFQNLAEWTLRKFCFVVLGRET